MRSVLRSSLIGVAALIIATITPATADGSHHSHPSHSTPRLLVGDLGSGSGSTVGPDGALYVAQPVAGTITRVDRHTGAASTFATGLPTRVAGLPIGGVSDVAFLGHKAYALVTLVGPDVGGTSAVGLYRLRHHGAPRLVADIGAWSIAHPPTTAFEVPSGVQYAMQPWHGGFLVTDGHHNRVLKVSTHGDVRQVIQLENVVPTGLDIAHRRVYLAEAGPVPHDPADGKIVTFRVGASTTHEVASGASILTDVELAGSGRGHGYGRHHRGSLYAISNGTFSGDPAGSPGLPDTGSLVKADRHGGFRVIATDLDRPTSLELGHRAAYIVTFDGEVWTVPLRR